MSEKNNEQELDFSQNDIELRDHCLVNDSWEHAVGYLMYAMEFPMRVDMSDVLHAMEICFPDHYGQEWGEFEQFREELDYVLDLITRLDQHAQNSLIEQLYFRFSKNVESWLYGGIEESGASEEPDCTPIINTETGITEKQVLQWRRRTQQTKWMQKAQQENAERLKKEENKNNGIRIRRPYKPHRDAKFEWIKSEKTSGYYRRARYCWNCKAILARYVRKFCDANCQDEYTLKKIPNLIDKYFPHAARGVVQPWHWKKGVGGPGPGNHRSTVDYVPKDKRSDEQ